MKKFRILAFVLALVLALAPVAVFAEDEAPKYEMDPAHLTFASQDDFDAIVYRQDGKAPSKETTYSLENGELKLTLTDKGSSTGNPDMPDPMVYLTFGKLASNIKAEDYPYIAVIYRMPKTNSTKSNALQIFCCTDGDMPSADTVQPNAATTADGKYNYAILNPGAFVGEVPVPGLDGTYYKEWKGTVTSLRLDYFLGFPYPVDNGDTIYIHDIIFYADQTTATREAKAITTDLNLPDELTLSFVVGDHGTAPDDQLVKKGENPVRPDDPAPADGFVFDNWYTTKTYSTVFNFDAPLTKEKVFVYAKWVKGFAVTFDCGEGEITNAPAAQTVKQNGRAVEPDQPERDGYTFRGWYADEERTEAFDFSKLIKADTVVYALWEEGEAAKYPITVVNGSADRAEAKAGTKVTVAADAAPEGQRFDHWEITGILEFLNEDDKEGFNETFEFRMCEGSVTLTAVFVDIPKYTVTVKNGTADVTEAIPGTEITVTANDPADGQFFDHWKITGNVEFMNEDDKDGTKPSFTFRMCEGGATLEAVYADESGMIFYPVTVVNGTADAETAKAGTEITVTAAEAPEGQKFDHWEIEGNVEFMNEEDKEGTKPSFTFRQCEGGATLTAVFVSAATPGDVDGNGKLNAKDVTAIMKHLVGKTPEKFDLAAADFDGNGKLNAKDVTGLMKYLVTNPA